MRLKLIIIAATIAVLVAGAYWKGRIDNEAGHTAEALIKAENDAAATERLAAVEEANRKLSRALEDQAYAEPVTDGCGLPVSRVLRLNER